MQKDKHKMLNRTKNMVLIHNILIEKNNPITSIQKQQKQRDSSNRYYHASVLLIICIGITWIIGSITLFTTSTSVMESSVQVQQQQSHQHHLVYDGVRSRNNLFHGSVSDITSGNAYLERENNRIALTTHEDSSSNVSQEKKEVKLLREERSSSVKEVSIQQRQNQKSVVSKSLKYASTYYYATLPLEKTPSSIGAKKGEISCDDVNVNNLVYWNDPQGTKDINFQTPFTSSSNRTNYITFEPDRGGWNNIRMSIEIMFVIAVATNRTLVLPPDQPLYLLDKDARKKKRGFGDFFPLDSTSLNHHVPVITMEEFMKREGGNSDGGLLPIAPQQQKQDDLSSSSSKPWLSSETFCIQTKSDKVPVCGKLNDHLRNVGYVPKWKGEMNGNCVIFDIHAFHGMNMTLENESTSNQFCAQRKKVHYTKQIHESSQLIHFQTSDHDYRLLDHFYMFLHFTDPKLDNFFKRFIRDFLHYNDLIFCTAGKIIQQLQQEILTSFSQQHRGYVSMHIRRGDFQYHDLKPTSKEMYDTIKDDGILLPNDVIYIATDEKNKSFFDFFSQRNHTIKFLDDYWTPNLSEMIDPNYMGMIDTIIASHGREFIGTYCSTFTGYINRLRGYIGYSMKHSWFTTRIEKKDMHSWPNIFQHQPFYREWPNAWVRIDGDSIVSKDDF